MLPPGIEGHTRNETSPVLAGSRVAFAAQAHWRPVHFGSLLIGITTLVRALAFVSGTKFAVEAAGGMLIVAVGFGD